MTPPGHGLLDATPGIAASTGSASHSDTPEPSPVLTAMGLDAARSLAAIRLSLGRWITTEHVDRAADVIAASATRTAART
jgi:cysteine desulfurase